MLVEDSSCYIIKQSKGTTWNLFRNTNGEVVYKRLESGIWSQESLLIKHATNCYSVCLAPDDTINVFFQDISGDIKLLSFIDNRWSEKLLLKKKTGSTNSIYFKAILENNNVHLIYSIPDEKGVFSAFIHQISYLGGKLQEPRTIEIVKHNGGCPFRVYLSSSSDIILMYEKNDNNSELGYRVYQSKLRQWSDFLELDSIDILKDISLLSIKNKNYISYIKSNGNIDSLAFLPLEGESASPKVIEGTGILYSCTIYCIDEQIWLLADSENKINSWFSVDGGNNFNVVSDITNNSARLIKAKYISNYTNEKEHLTADEIFANKGNLVNIPIIDELYPMIVDNRNTEVSLQDASPSIGSYAHRMKSIISDANKQLSDLEGRLMDKDSSIRKLNNVVETYKSKFEDLERSYGELSLKYNELNSNHNNLKKLMDSLQNELIVRESKINELMNNNLSVHAVLLKLQTELDKIKKESASLKEDLIKVNKEKEKLQADLNEATLLIQKNKESFIIVNKEKEKLETDLNEANLLILKNKESFIKRFFGGNS